MRQGFRKAYFKGRHMQNFFQKTFFRHHFFLSISCQQGQNAPVGSIYARRRTTLFVGLLLLWFSISGLRTTCSGQETPLSKVDSTAHASLMRVDWLLGDWIYNTTELRLECSIRWSPSGNYIVSHDTARAPDGSIVYRQVRVIGFNPISELLQAWIFRSDGGFGSALFQQFGDSWIVPTRLILADGRVTTATNIYTPVKTGGYIWKSISRTLNNVELPALGPVPAQATTLPEQSEYPLL